MQPLEGIRVIDLTHVLAGPTATHHLRCMGAEVIKIERPGGDPIRGPGSDGLSPTYRALNAGKKSIVADLTQPEQRKALLRMIATADVFVENFRPGAARRLGLAPADVRAVKPDIIYCSISGWGQAGSNAGRAAYDHVIQAATGMMAQQGVPGEPPVKVGFPVIDIATGLSAAEAILAALIRRLRGDRDPITIDVSMIDSALALMAGPVASTLATGAAPPRVGNRGFVGSPGAETFATADGHISVAANTKQQFTMLCGLLGRPDLAGPPHVPSDLPGGAFLANLATDVLRAELSRAFAGTWAADLEAKLNAAGIPASKVRGLDEYLTEVYPQTPGIGAEGEPIALRPAFRWEEAAPALSPAVAMGTDNALLQVAPSPEPDNGKG